jgi:thiol-disulfide isomerase/thioredoxin
MKRIYTVILMMLLLAASVFAQESSKDAGAMMMAPEASEAGAGATMMMDSAPGPAMMGSGGKVLFTGLENARALAAAGPAVLFFHAGWCPTCRAAMSEIDARLSELGNITVVVVDYDSNKKLRKQYGVTYQHTYVQIDGDGEKIALWNGGGVDGILGNVVKGGM